MGAEDSGTGFDDAGNRIGAADEDHAGKTGENRAGDGAAKEGAAKEGAKGRSAFARQQREAADSLDTVAGALHQAAEELNRRNRTFTGNTVDSAARQVDRVADTLRQRDLDGLLGEAEAFARRHPELFLGGAVAAGFVVARILKNSNERRSARAARRAGGGPPGNAARDLEARIARDHDAWADTGPVAGTGGYRGGFTAAAGPASMGGTTGYGPEGEYGAPEGGYRPAAAGEGSAPEGGI